MCVSRLVGSGESALGCAPKARNMARKAHNMRRGTAALTSTQASLTRRDELGGEDGDGSAQENVTEEYLEHHEELAKGIAGSDIPKAKGRESHDREVPWREPRVRTLPGPDFSPRRSREDQEFMSFRAPRFARARLREESATEVNSRYEAHPACGVAPSEDPSLHFVPFGMTCSERLASKREAGW